MRPSGRKLSEPRVISIETGVTRHAEGSCLIRVGDTHVICTATIEDKPPPFLKNTGLGWVTAEYGMLPRATNTRTRREAAAGKQSGRTQEIQRLIGRALRAGVDRVFRPAQDQERLHEHVRVVVPRVEQRNPAGERGGAELLPFLDACPELPYVAHEARRIG